MRDTFCQKKKKINGTLPQINCLNLQEEENEFAMDLPGEYVLYSAIAVILIENFIEIYFYRQVS